MMTRQEIAEKYGITVKTLKKYCIENGIILPVRGLLSPALCSQIFELLEGNILS